jgi:alpha-L-fucosidase 2
MKVKPRQFSIAFIRFICAMNCLIATTDFAKAASLPVPARGFVSSQPATIWEEGLLSGNGTIGINVFSRPLNERIIFTHERLFVPMGAPLMPPDQAVRLFEIRRLIERGLYQQATELQFNLSGQESFMYPDNFVPAFDLAICSANHGAVRDYSRSVDFQTGETAVRWSDDRGGFERRMFVSRADHVAVLVLTATKPGSLDCQLALTPRDLSDEATNRAELIKRSDEAFREYVTNIQTSSTGNSLAFRNGFTKSYPGSIHLLEGYARVIATGGRAEAQTNGTLVVSRADRILIFVDLRPVYDPDKPEMKNMEAALAKLPDDYALLLQRHAKLHGALFNRMRLDLGGGADHQRTTEELIAASTYEKPNCALIEKEFDAGRYNIICSTGELPPNLQGVWGGTYVPGWASDYTHNGNVPSAIAANLMGNMPELMLAYTGYIESLVPWLEINAKHLFGARGIVLPSRSSTHGFNNALAPKFAGGFWVGGAGWAAHFFYDYYLYTGDRNFLAEHALPFMEKAALFLEDYLYEGPDGKWVFSPTQSPENTPGNSKSQGSFNATMDVAVAKELLRNTIAASLKLGCSADKIPRWQQMLAKMQDYQVDERGIIKEWLTPKLANNDSHRHSSQLYPLYDGLPDEIARSPELRAAFRKSIEFKLDNYWQNNQLGFMSFGLVQLGQAAASLGEGELAYRCLTQLINRYWLNNLASMHNHRSLFNMDISGGMPAVLIKMLVATEPGTVQLLPALPKAWSTGTIEGVLCRGQIEIKRLHWSPEGVECVLRSGRAQTVTLEMPVAVSKITVDDKGATVFNGDSANQRQLALPAECEVTVKISCKL